MLSTPVHFRTEILNELRSHSNRHIKLLFCRPTVVLRCNCTASSAGITAEKLHNAPPQQHRVGTNVVEKEHSEAIRGKVRLPLTQRAARKRPLLWAGLTHESYDGFRLQYRVAIKQLVAITHGVLRPQMLNWVTNNVDDFRVDRTTNLCQLFAHQCR